MHELTAKIGPRGVITIPLELRTRMKLKPGDRIRFLKVQSGGYRLKPIRKKVSS